MKYAHLHRAPYSPKSLKERVANFMRQVLSPFQEAKIRSHILSLPYISGKMTYRKYNEFMNYSK